MQYALYSYAEAIIRESNADKAMELFGDNRIAASALVKMKYYDLYEWEKGTYDEPCDAEKEEYDTSLLKNEIQSFKASIKQNTERWTALIKNEIISRAATHPTLKMRLETLNVAEPVALFPESSSEYISECEKATEYVSLLIANENKPSYEEYRKNCYLEPKKLINAKKDLCIMHPLPRVNEISVAVDDDPRACYFKQVLYGKYIRMALILKLLEEAEK